MAIAILSSVGRVVVDADDFFCAVFGTTLEAGVVLESESGKLVSEGRATSATWTLTLLQGPS